MLRRLVNLDTAECEEDEYEFDVCEMPLLSPPEEHVTEYNSGFPCEFFVSEDSGRQHYDSEGPS